LQQHDGFAVGDVAVDDHLQGFVHAISCNIKKIYANAGTPAAAFQRRQAGHH
jgi:hypothetical protein